MTSGHGGRRLGAGRKPGSPTKRRREIIDKAADAGITPLELQLRTMCELWRQAHARGEMDLALAKEACAVAAQCAPYIHPRLSAVEAKIEAHHFRMSPQERRRLIDAVDRLDSILDGRVIDMVPALLSGNDDG
jgi:hypothetical protein